MRTPCLVHKEYLSLILVGLFHCSGFSCYRLYYTESNTWTTKKTTGESPKAMSSSGAVYGNNLYVFGGVLDGEAQNTLHCLDMSEFMICLMSSAPTQYGQIVLSGVLGLTLCVYQVFGD